MSEQTAQQVEWWIKTGAIYGLGFVALAVGVLLAFVFLFALGRECVRFVSALRTDWAPKIVNGHITFLAEQKANGVRQTAALETLSESHTVSSESHGKTHRVLGRMVKAAREATTCEDVHRHLDEALDELRGK